jgi:hypothetical protein
MFVTAANFAAVQRRKCNPRLCLSQLSVISEFISESAVKRQPQKKQQTTDTERDPEKTKNSRP